MTCLNNRHRTRSSGGDRRLLRFPLPVGLNIRTFGTSRKAASVTAEEEENEKKALVAVGMAAGLVLGVVGTFAAIVKAAWDQAATKKGDDE